MLRVFRLGRSGKLQLGPRAKPDSEVGGNSRPNSFRDSSLLSGQTRQIVFASLGTEGLGVNLGPPDRRTRT